VVGKALSRSVAAATFAVGVVGLTVDEVALAMGLVAGCTAEVLGGLGVVLGGNKASRVLASRWKRVRWRASSKAWAGSTLMATCRPSESCWAS
jgi:hypothetical protein